MKVGIPYTWHSHPLVARFILSLKIEKNTAMAHDLKSECSGKRTGLLQFGRDMLYHHADWSLVVGSSIVIAVEVMNNVVMLEHRLQLVVRRNHLSVLEVMIIVWHHTDLGWLCGASQVVRCVPKHAGNFPFKLILIVLIIVAPIVVVNIVVPILLM